jgi:acyl-CoA synthetase (AMP-forming)/AMP-acid ligase II
VEVIHAWGMTEMSPLGTLSKLKAQAARPAGEQQQRLLQKQGRVIYGVDMTVVDDEGKAVPWDGRVRATWWCAGRGSSSQLLQARRIAAGRVDGKPGWFPTGDVATIDADGFMQITDRSKDVIKSGGEWISSIDLENIAMAHPAVHEAAAIAARHPKWDERPLLVVVKKPDATVHARGDAGLLRRPHRQVADPR